MKPTYKILNSYDHLIAPASGSKYPVVDGPLTSAIDMIERITLDYNWQVKGLATHLKDKDKLQSCFNIWHFCTHNFKYKLDDPNVDEYREPAKSWKDRFTGIDCDCFTIFCNSLLIQMGYKIYKPQMITVHCKGFKDYHHIYSALGCYKNKLGIVEGGIVIDPVMKQESQFNTHPPDIIKSIIKDMNFKHLAGFPVNIMGLGGYVSEMTPTTQKLMDLQSDLLSGASLGLGDNCKEKVLANLRTIADDIIKLRTAIMLNGTEEQNSFITLMPHIKTITPTGNYIFHDDDKASVVLQGLGIYMGGDVDDYLNGKVAEAIKKAKEDAEKKLKDAFNKAQAAAKELAAKAKAAADKAIAAAKEAKDKAEAAAKDLANKAKEAAQKAADAAKELAQKAADKLKEAAKLAEHNLAKIDPIMMTTRNAYRTVLMFNVFNHAKLLSIGTGTLAEAQARGYSESDYNAHKDKFENTVVSLWYKLGGDRSYLYDSIQKGKNKKPLWGIKGKNKNVSGLGEFSLAAVGTAVTACTAIITSISAVFKSLKKNKEDEVSDGPKDGITYPYTCEDGSQVLNAEGDVLYANGSKYDAKTDTIIYPDGSKTTDPDKANVNNGTNNETESDILNKTNNTKDDSGSGTNNKKNPDDEKSNNSWLWWGLGIGGAFVIGKITKII